eukprot:sb/3462956/
MLDSDDMDYWNIVEQPITPKPKFNVDIFPNHRIFTLFQNYEEIPGFNETEGETWVYPVNYPLRYYQYNIVQKALFWNTLVTLPTGKLSVMFNGGCSFEMACLGKTFVAAVVIHNFYRWYPKGKILFMAPTKPLVAQQIRACHDIVASAVNNVINVITLTILPCYTLSIQYPHSDKQVVRELQNYTTQFRVLALSATPGDKLETVQSVLSNLLIAHVEIRSEESLDIQPYTHDRKVQKSLVKIEGPLAHIRDNFIKEVLDGFVDHPKLPKLLECLHNHFSSTPDTRAMVFSSYRDSVQDLVKNINREDGSLLKATAFVGQSGEKGLKQKQQLQTVADFKSGKFNILFITNKTSSKDGSGWQKEGRVYCGHVDRGKGRTGTDIYPPSLIPSLSICSQKASFPSSDPKLKSYRGLSNRRVANIFQIFTVHYFHLFYTKFQLSTSSGACLFKASKTSKSAMVYSTGVWQAFTRLCVEVLRVLSLLFFELEGISKVGALPPHPRRTGTDIYISPSLIPSLSICLQKASFPSSDPKLKSYRGLSNRRVANIFQIFTVHYFHLFYTKFQLSTSSGACLFKASKTSKSAMVYSTGVWQAFTRLCVEVLRVLSLLFLDLEGVSKVGGSAPTPPFWARGTCQCYD